jgi:hypothetical protein
MATLPVLYCMNASDAPRHLGKIQQLSRKFKQEQRITDFVPILAADALTTLPGNFKENDLIILLLTYGLEAKRKDTATLLTKVKDKFPESNIAEIVIDNIPLVNEYITLPKDLKPIRDALNMDAAWNEIEENLKEMLPTRALDWKKYLKYTIPVMVALAALLIWIPWEKKLASSEKANSTYTFNNGGSYAVKLTASRNDRVDATEHKTIVGNKPAQTPSPIAKFIPNKTECMIPCTISFTNQSQNTTAFNWDFGDGSSSTDTNPSHKYTVGGDYQIRLVALREDQRIEATAKVKVKDIVNVEPFNIVTASNDASLVAGDREIDSDDWTSVEVSYAITIVNARREIQLRVEWYAQERNSNKSKGNTRFMSSKNYTVFNIASCCPGTMIDNVTGIDMSANREQYYQGEAHGYKPFPTTGSLQNIKVKFDGAQANDLTLQALTATLTGFSVKLRASN